MLFELAQFGEFVKIENDHGEQVMFDVRSYKSARIDSAGDIFKPLNDYLRRLPAITQTTIFGLYMEAKDIFMSTRHEEVLDKLLKDFFRRLFTQIDMQSLRNFVEINSGILIPHDIKNNYADVEAGFIRDKTYIREEYIELLTNTVAVRLCFPIWGEYMSIVESYATADGKEFHAYSLLQDSWLPMQPAYERLIRYVTASTTTSVETASSTLKGVGRDKIPEWLTSMVIVRKLPIIDLFNTAKGNIINAVYSYVDNHLKRLPKKFMEDARERKNEGSSGDGEKDQSFVETYRAKQEISYGQLETTIVYLEGDLTRCCQDIDPTFDPNIMEAVEAVAMGLENEAFHHHNHILTQWVVDKSISTLQPDIIERRVAIRSMLIAQAILHHWGLHNLALMATGVRISNTTNHQLGDAVAKLTTAELETLDLIYPHQAPNLAKASGRNKNANYGYLSIMEMASELVRYSYAVRTPAFLSVKEVAVNRYGHMSPPSTISHELVKMIVKIDEIQE